MRTRVPNKNTYNPTDAVKDPCSRLHVEPPNVSGAEQQKINLTRFNQKLVLRAKFKLKTRAFFFTPFRSPIAFTLFRVGAKMSSPLSHVLTCQAVNGGTRGLLSWRDGSKKLNFHTKHRKVYQAINFFRPIPSLRLSAKRAWMEEPRRRKKTSTCRRPRVSEHSYFQLGKQPTFFSSDSFMFMIKHPFLWMEER